MDHDDISALLDALESAAGGPITPPPKGKRAPRVTPEQAWASIHQLAEKHNLDIPTNQPPPQIPEAGSTSLFSSPEPASSDDTETGQFPSLEHEGVTRSEAQTPCPAPAANPRFPSPARGRGARGEGQAPGPEPAPGDSALGSRTCSATTRAGNPCRTYARKDSDYCYAHDNASREQFIASSATAGIASGESRRKPHFEIDHVLLGSPTTLMVALDALFRLELTGQLPTSRTRNLVRILALASRAVPRDAEIDLELYKTWQDSLNLELEAAIEAQRKADLERAVDIVRNETMQRGQLAKDLDDYPVLDKRPASARKLDWPDTHYRSARDHPDYR